jgi:hypothetical protein
MATLVAKRKFVMEQLELLVLGAGCVGGIVETNEVIREPIMLVSGRDLRMLDHFLTSDVPSSSIQSNWVKLEVSEFAFVS